MLLPYMIIISSYREGGFDAAEKDKERGCSWGGGVPCGRAAEIDHKEHAFAIQVTWLQRLVKEGLKASRAI